MLPRLLTSLFAGALAASTCFAALPDTATRSAPADASDTAAPAAVATTPAAPLRIFAHVPNPKITEIWNNPQLFATPRTFPVDTASPVSAPADFAPFVAKDGITPVFFEGEPLAGNPTRVFAWLGVPSSPGPFPGVVLVHGGGGTAYRDWVKIWMDRGYAAIAMDTNGATPLGEETMRVKAKGHAFAGPSAKASGIPFSELPPRDQWVYHAVSTVIRAHSLLRATPRVDSERIGLTGISWGGVMTEITAAIDNRFKCAAPVYACGFLGEDSFWLDKHFQEATPAQSALWLSLWDPAQYIPLIKMPVLFTDGTNDKFFRLGSWQKTTALSTAPTTLSLRVRMTHGHAPHGDPAEVAVFMDSFLKGGKPLPVIGQQGRDGDSAWVKFTSADDVSAARFNYTTDTGPWLARNWLNAPVKLAPGRINAAIPPGTTAYYFNLTAARGANVSSPIITPPVP